MSDHEAEIGYWLGKDFWGKGYATEAVQSVVAYAFEELSLVRLWAGAYQENTPSQRVLEKCGFYPHHTDEHFLSTATGETHRAVIYALEKA